MNDKLKHSALDYLNKECSGLTIYLTNRWSDSIFFMKDDRVIYEYDTINGEVYISYDKIWSLIKSLFDLNSSEMNTLIREWVKNNHKLKVIESWKMSDVKSFWVEEQYKLDTNE